MDDIKIPKMRGFRIPQVNIQKAILYYYTKPDLSSDDIKDLFDGRVSTGTLYRMKRAARDKEIELGKTVFGAYCVNTECAYLAWGLDIEKLERNLKKLQKMGLLPEMEVRGHEGAGA